MVGPGWQGLGSPEDRYLELSRAVDELSSRCLQQSVRWAAEMLMGLPEDVLEKGAVKAASDKAKHLEPEHPAFILARSYFEQKEYHRVTHTLRDLPGPRALFLRCYAYYLVGEQRKEEERIQKAGPLGGSSTAAAGAASAAGASTTPPATTSTATNPHLASIATQLSEAAAAGVSDAFTQYLAGMVALDQGRLEEGQQLLVESLAEFPCNWSAWMALLGPSCDLEAVTRLPLLPHWAREAFLAQVAVEAQQAQEALSRLQVLNQLFPRSSVVTLAVAQVHYSLYHYADAQELFEDLLASDPYCLAGMDIYSNILYVTEQAGALTHLAHRLAETHKYTPEACCVMGNYYSLKLQHSRAVECFRRALRLNPRYLSAWTLMGHEYVELKNAPAAIDAYRHAVEISPRDYRAWYGLGQTYELLQMPHYALYYYHRAAAVRPGDARMWAALGQCYEGEGVGLARAAVRCYQKALDTGDTEGLALSKLAALHDALGERAAAASYYRRNLERLQAAGINGQDNIDALLYLAEYCKDEGLLAEAEAYCQQLLDVGGAANLRAKSILRELRSNTTTTSSSSSRPAAAAGRGGNDPGSSGTLPPDAASGAMAAPTPLSEVHVGGAGREWGPGAHMAGVGAGAEIGMVAGGRRGLQIRQPAAADATAAGAAWMAGGGSGAHSGGPLSSSMLQGSPMDASSTPGGDLMQQMSGGPTPGSVDPWGWMGAAMAGRPAAGGPWPAAGSSADRSRSRSMGVMSPPDFPGRGVHAAGIAVWAPPGGGGGGAGGYEIAHDSPSADDAFHTPAGSPTDAATPPAAAIAAGGVEGVAGSHLSLTPPPAPRARGRHVPPAAAAGHSLPSSTAMTSSSQPAAFMGAGSETATPNQQQLHGWGAVGSADLAALSDDDMDEALTLG